MTDQLKPLGKEDRAKLKQHDYVGLDSYMIRALLTIDDLEFRIDQAEPGTAAAIVNAVFDLAESECGHNPVSARHGLTTIGKWITDAKARIDELEKERDHWQKQAEEWDQYTDEMEGQREKLVRELKAAAPVVCGYLCPSVWKTADGPPPHSESCVRLTEALREIGEGKAKND